jgi:hypothetical protein
MGKKVVKIPRAVRYVKKFKNKKRTERILKA